VISRSLRSLYGGRRPQGVAEGDDLLRISQKVSTKGLQILLCKRFSGDFTDSLYKIEIHIHRIYKQYNTNTILVQMQMDTPLMTLPSLLRTQIVKRPSLHIKSPYVADIQVNGEDELAHTASLGCNGYNDAGANVYVLDTTTNKKKDTKCKFRVCLTEVSLGDSNQMGENQMGDSMNQIGEKGYSIADSNKVLVGTHPKYAEDMAEQLLLQNKMTILPNIRSYIREFTVCLPEHGIDSRFDFCGMDETGTPFLMEIKTVPLADYEDIPTKERKRKLRENPNIYSHIPCNQKVAYFPDGYRKSMDDPVSPRALKHVRELLKIKQISRTRCILCFIIQRDDVVAFSPSNVDPEYRQAVLDAIAGGVEVIAVVIKWIVDTEGCGRATFIKTVPIV